MFSESSSESMCMRDSNLAVKCDFRFYDDSVSDYEYGGCSMCSSDSDDSVSDQSKRSRGHTWLMHIQNANLPVDVEVENVALRLEWQFRTNQRSDIARAEISKLRQNPIYINWPRSEQSPILLLLPSPEFLCWKLHKLCF